MTEESDNKTIQFPEQPPEGAVKEVGSPMPQGFGEYFKLMREIHISVGEIAGPYQGKHPALDTAYSEVLRYLELSSMYMERFGMLVSRPEILGKKKDEGDNGPA